MPRRAAALLVCAVALSALPAAPPPEKKFTDPIDVRVPHIGTDKGGSDTLMDAHNAAHYRKPYFFDSPSIVHLTFTPTNNAGSSL